MNTQDDMPRSLTVSFSGPTTFTQDEIATACRLYGLHLRTPGTIDGARLLWALAGQKSSFGADCQPRHEAEYCTGEYRVELAMATLKFGHAAHCSFGPWQLLWANTSRSRSPDQSFGTLNDCVSLTVNFLNRGIIARQRAASVEQVADAYSSGNIADVLHFYKHAPMPLTRQHSVQIATHGTDVSRGLCDAGERLRPGRTPGSRASTDVGVGMVGRLASCPHSPLLSGAGRLTSSAHSVPGPA